MANLNRCRCAALHVEHWHLITDAGLTVAAPIRSRGFLAMVIKHLSEEHGTEISVAAEERRRIRNQECTRWERNHLSSRALHNLCRVSGG